MVHYDPYDYKTHDDPYPVYRQLREEAPVYYNETYGFWILSRYADVQRAFREFKSFSCVDGTSLEPLKEQVPTVLTTDPPDHTRLRHLMSAAFTPQSVQPLEDAIRSMARELLAPFRQTGQLDVITDYAARLPMAVICRLLGFPRADEDMLRNWTDQVVHRDEGVFEMPEGGADATRKLYGYYEALMQARHDGGGFGADLVGKLMDAEAAGRLSHPELMGYLYILSIAGNETTTKLIGNMAYQLHHHPDQKAEVVADRRLVPAVVEETMRFDGPTQLMARSVARPTEMHGQTLLPGQKVGILLISGNRDDRKYPDAERFDIHRNARDHLGFGFGLHACMGAALARLEARIAFEELLEVAPDFVVDETGLNRMHSPNVRGFTTVPISFGRLH